ncbi:MAG: Lon-like protease [Gaiellaceae bacterium]|nr:Lon-like protease [Gaiellaceae bacterium]
MKALVTPLRIVAGLVVALVVAMVILLKISSGYYLFVPDVAHPVAPLVSVHGGKPRPDADGRLYFVDVHEIQASEFDILFQWLHPHSTKVPAARLLPPGTNNTQYFQAARREMAISQQIAGAVAEKELGYPVVTRNNGVLVDIVYGDVPAASKIDSADIITAANGKPTTTIADLHDAVKSLEPGDIVKLTIRRGSSTVHEDVKTVADPHNKQRALIGVQVEQSMEIHLPIKVSIDSENIGGPSAGLAFTLELMRQLGRDVTHGYKIAATGQIHLDGSVTAIGGVEQKVWGVRDAGAQVFLVPVDGGNAKEAKKYAGPDLTIIPVTSVDQALHALAHLPKLR